MSTEDRRAPGATRMPFDGLVEVGGALGPSFEAQAVNVSEEGIHLRTAYLPELGQPLTCRFDGGPSKSVLVAGEVVWSQGEAKGGEFGVRFTEMDAESVDALKGLCGVGGNALKVQPGSKVRLHIEGLASPMRARIKDSHPTEVTVGSELGFLQVGRQLELEDAQNGGKRPACIDRVEVAVDPNSNVPQLVVTLRYSDVQAQVDAARGAGPAVEASPHARSSDDLAAVEEASRQMKGALASSIARIGPAFERFARRAKTTVALIAQRRALRIDDGGASRRTTSLPPGGGLHASGRRVVRGESSPSLQPSLQESPPKLQVTKRKAIVAGAVMMAAIAGALVLKKAHHETDVAATTAEGARTPGSAGFSEATGAPAPASPTMLAATPLPADPGPALAAPPVAGPVAAADDEAESAQGAHKKHARVAPFGNGPVHHGNVMHLKMDGAIDSLEGAQQPTGFAVKVPGRRALEAAGPLAARDSRIAAIKVSNDPAGAELTVTFRDGVPNYLVSAKGDTLVISLAPAGSPDKLAKKDDKGAKSSKHSKHEKKKSDAN